MTPQPGPNDTTAMTTTEHQAILTIAVLAALADGQKHERERGEIKRVADSLGQAEGVHLPALVQDVLLQRANLASAVPQLTSADARLLAYEMAVCVCDADGAQSPAERTFLDDLNQRLGLAAPVAAAFAQQADAMVAAPLPLPDGASLPGATPAAVASVDNAALDADILNAAILNGALELLPESLSTLAIIPLQMKLVYRIGLAHGHQLDSGHVKDFLATAGVGLTSQYLEQAARKLLGRFGGGLLGGVLGGVGKQCVSSGLSFATTYALGQVAKRYYAGGRVLSTQMLKDAYASSLQQAQALQAQYGPAMHERSRTIDAGKLLAMVRGR